MCANSYLHEDTHTLTVESVEINVLDTGATRFGGKRIKHKILKNTVSMCWRQVIVAKKYLSIFMNFDHTISLSLTISSIDINPRPVNFFGNKNARYIKYLNKN